MHRRCHQLGVVMWRVRVAVTRQDAQVGQAVTATADHGTRLVVMHPVIPASGWRSDALEALAMEKRSAC